MAHTTGGCIVGIDADLSHDPVVILHRWAAREDVGLVIASRYVRGGQVSMPLSRQVLSCALNVFVRFGLSLQIRDVSSGFRLYRREALEGIALRAPHFDVLEEVLVQILAAGWRIVEIPFHYRPRRAASSKARLLVFGWRFLLSFPRLRRLPRGAVPREPLLVDAPSRPSLGSDSSRGWSHARGLDADRPLCAASIAVLILG